MSRTIWKVALDLIDEQKLQFPIGAEILCAREQHDQICIWYRCIPTNDKEARKVAIIGTGHDAPDDGQYIGTASLRGGMLIFHVFVWPS